MNGSAGQRCERLLRLHDVQIVVQLDAKCLQHLVEHKPVLGCRNRDGLEVLRLLLEFKDNWGELDRIGTGTEDDGDFLGVHYIYLVLELVINVLNSAGPSNLLNMTISVIFKIEKYAKRVSFS